MLFKRWETEEIVGKMPARTGIVPTANQLAQQGKFRLAALYGKTAMADADTKRIYADAGASFDQNHNGIPDFLEPKGTSAASPAAK